MEKKLIEHTEKQTYTKSSDYVSIFGDVQAKLQSQINFLERAFQTPLLFFTDSKYLMHTPHALIFKNLLANYSLEKEKKPVDGHDLQAFIGSKLNEVFQVWLKENNIDWNAHIQVRHPNSFPSAYGLYIEDMEVYQFDIYKQAYTNKGRPETEDRILESGKKEEQRLREQIEQTEEDLAYLRKLQKNKFQYFNDFHTLLQIVFKPRIFKKKLVKRIEQLERTLEDQELRLKKNRKELPIVVDRNKRRQHYLDTISPFFEHFNYTYDEKHLNIL